ncbi:SCP-like extracellular protein [Alkaliphilus metalliredigens QYMF]|uniref:SCP-like extracellular protein n=1 Tax=Alkaliphilus metalliredigens (strain QYMF) TaxID=293826 RepID=A6TMH6_ALKMQ|nr:CAP domain-containing protein [Alkaliphilus metalliredigens]ABR47394.1 SCP-like extracellular protein [Alkaliphilus metalliredigens QYMF]
MKNKFSISIVFFVLLFLISSCRGTSEEPMATKQSSIFKEAEVSRVIVQSNSLIVHSGNSTDFPMIKEVSQDTVLSVIGKSDDWYIVILDSGQVGCVSQIHVSPYIEAPDTSMNSSLREKIAPNEQRMFDLVNQERIKHNLSPLELDLELTRVARLKSQDMIDDNYFNHYSPSYGSPFEMLEKFGVQYIYAGENLAGNHSVETAHTSLMDSPTHRENILNPNFTNVGIGIREGGPYGKMFTQMFVGR